MRADISFPSSGSRCAGWFYRANGEGERPAVLMAHGLGAVKEIRLDAYAGRFAEAGYHVLVFDYRHFGESGGEPRQLLDIGRQLEDWRAAIAWMRQRTEVDAGKLALWGTSLSGGHVMAVAAGDPGIAAVVAQVPHVNGRRAIRAKGIGDTARLMPHALLDAARGLFGLSPHYVLSSGEPGEAALITAPGQSKRYLELVPPGQPFDRRVAARFALVIPFYSPGIYLRQLTMPVLLQVCLEDSVTPPDAAISAARKAPRVNLKTYSGGHFDPYTSPLFDTVVRDQIRFLNEALA